MAAISAFLTRYPCFQVATSPAGASVTMTITSVPPKFHFQSTFPPLNDAAGASALHVKVRNAWPGRMLSCFAGIVDVSQYQKQYSQQTRHGNTEAVADVSSKKYNHSCRCLYSMPHVGLITSTAELKSDFRLTPQ
jgi:hypothetical protein